jgi:hypothetical protein
MQQLKAAVFEPAKQADAAFQLAKQVHDKMKLDPSGAKGMIPGALKQVEQINGQAAEAKREDVAQLCASVETYLNSMASREAYYSAFAATLDHLSRRAASVRD